MGAGLAEMGCERKKRAAENAEENLEIRFLVEEDRELALQPVPP